MATVTHIIRSYYDPADREQLERETGQRIETNDNAGPSSDPWQTESAFSAQRRIRAAPSFVPATISYDEWGAPVPLHPSLSLGLSSSTTGAGAGTESIEPAQLSTSSAAWYRSLTAAVVAKSPRDSATTGESPSQSSLPSLPPPAPLRPSSAPTLTGNTATPGTEDAVTDANATPRSHNVVPPTKRDWFIHNALRSDPSLSRMHASPSGSGPNSPAPSLADLLARDPPPLPGESRFTPPVWLHIGPSNRGFGMLQRSGWREGEGLGSHVVQQGNTASSPIRVKDNAGSIDQAHEVIDLTRSDSEVTEDEDIVEEEDVVRSDLAGIEVAASRDDASAPHMQRSLLTPLPTVLKADRLGIGLKAKTEGPYKQSKKRVTHSAAALAAHIRAAEELRRKKAEVGRGRRGFAKTHKREEDGRKRMLAYLNE